MSPDPNTINSARPDDESAERASHLRDRDGEQKMERVRDLAAEGRRTVPAGFTSAHDALYDEHGCRDDRRRRSRMMITACSIQAVFLRVHEHDALNTHRPWCRQITPPMP